MFDPHREAALLLQKAWAGPGRWARGRRGGGAVPGGDPRTSGLGESLASPASALRSQEDRGPLLSSHLDGRGWDESPIGNEDQVAIAPRAELEADPADTQALLTHVKMVRRACLDIVQLQGGPGELCSWYVLRIAKV